MYRIRRAQIRRRTRRCRRSRWKQLFKMHPVISQPFSLLQSSLLGMCYVSILVAGSVNIWVCVVWRHWTSWLTYCRLPPAVMPQSLPQVLNHTDFFRCSLHTVVETLCIVIVSEIMPSVLSGTLNPTIITLSLLSIMTIIVVIVIIITITAWHRLAISNDSL